jgi:V/A-type H+-transporting ATPase subunit A
LGSTFDFEEKDDARNFFNTLRQNFIDMNYKEFKSPDFNKAEKAMESTLASKNAKVSEEAKSLLKDGE